MQYKHKGKNSYSFTKGCKGITQSHSEILQNLSPCVNQYKCKYPLTLQRETEEEKEASNTIQKKCAKRKLEQLAF